MKLIKITAGSIVAYSIFMTVIILATTPQYAYIASYGACIQSFRKAYEQKKSLNYVFLVYRVAETSFANIFIIGLTFCSLFMISKRPTVNTSRRMNRDRYVSVTLLLISTVFVFCYSPFIVYIFFTLFPTVISRDAELVTGQTVLTLLELTSFFNPLIYICRNNSIQKIVWQHIQGGFNDIVKKFPSFNSWNSRESQRACTVEHQEVDAEDCRRGSNLSHRLHESVLSNHSVEPSVEHD